jgi:hypothetical protein
MSFVAVLDEFKERGWNEAARLNLLDGYLKECGYTIYGPSCTGFRRFLQKQVDEEEKAKLPLFTWTGLHLNNYCYGELRGTDKYAVIHELKTRGIRVDTLSSPSLGGMWTVAADRKYYKEQVERSKNAIAAYQLNLEKDVAELAKL